MGPFSLLLPKRLKKKTKHTKKTPKPQNPKTTKKTPQVSGDGCSFNFSAAQFSWAQ